MYRIPMTLKGVEKLHLELNKLKKVLRPKIIYAISEARKHGDLKENAEYHAAREEQAFCEKRIQEIETKLSNAQVIDIKNVVCDGTIVFGSTVSVLNMHTKKKIFFSIVGDDESDFKNGLISVNSPIARGLIGKKKMDIVAINTPSGIIEYQILDVQYI